MDSYIANAIKNSWYRLTRRGVWYHFESGQQNHICSWLNQRYGDKNGLACMHVDAVRNQDQVPIISFDIQETSQGKRTHTKRTMMTLYGESAQELYEMLKVAFEPTIADKMESK